MTTHIKEGGTFAATPAKPESGRTLSNCCKAPAYISSGLGEGTHYHVCSKCGKACDAHYEGQKQKPESGETKTECVCAETGFRNCPVHQEPPQAEGGKTLEEVYNKAFNEANEALGREARIEMFGRMGTLEPHCHHKALEAVALAATRAKDEEIERLEIQLTDYHSLLFEHQQNGAAKDAELAKKNEALRQIENLELITSRPGASEFIRGYDSGLMHAVKIASAAIHRAEKTWVR